MMENYSLSDIRAVTDNNGFGGTGNDSLIWLVVLFLFFGGGAFGGRNDMATGATQHEILLGQQFEGVHNKLNDISDGICNSSFALNNSITGEGRAIQSQLADCCCNTQLAIKDVMTSIHAEGEATRQLIQTNEIQTLRDKVADLQLAQSQCNQNAYLIDQLRPCPTPAYLAPNPYCNYNPCNWGCNNI